LFILSSIGSLGIYGLYYSFYCEADPFLLVALIPIKSYSIRSYSSSSDPVLLAAFIPIKIYSNAEDHKSQILEDTNNKSGISKWTNYVRI